MAKIRRFSKRAALFVAKRKLAVYGWVTSTVMFIDLVKRLPIKTREPPENSGGSLNYLIRPEPKVRFTEFFWF